MPRLQRDDWRRWRALERADRRLLVEAGVLVTLAQASIKLLSFRRTATLFGLRLHPTLAPEAPAGGPVPAIAVRTSWAVGVAAGRTPLPAKCLVQALAGAAMLGRRHVASTVHLGVAKDPRDPAGICAHAWLRCGDAVLTGAAGSEQFTPVAAFAGRGP